MARIYHFRDRVNDMPSTTIYDVAKFLLTFEPMTHKKLQKLCYYSYAWYLTLYKKRLFDNEFEAWIHGPVNPDLYHSYKQYGWNQIPMVEEGPDLSDEVNSFIQEVYESYGHLDGDQLEYLTHTEQPWKSARNGLEEWEPSNNVIDDDVIQDFYQSEFEDGQND